MLALSKPAPSKTARRAAGYTLVELMVVVSIIAGSVLMMAPGIGRTMSDQRVSTATRELIRIGRRARSDSFGYLRAHLLWIDPEGGRVRLLRGPTNSCRFAQWEELESDCSATPRGQACLEDLDLTSWGVRPIALFEQTADGFSTATRALCFTASGMVLSSGEELDDVAATLSDANLNNGGFVYTLHEGAVAPTATDRVHRVLFPLGSTPRSLR